MIFSSIYWNHTIKPWWYPTVLSSRDSTRAALNIPFPASNQYQPVDGKPMHQPHLFFSLRSNFWPSNNRRIQHPRFLFLSSHNLSLLQKPIQLFLITLHQADSDVFSLPCQQVLLWICVKYWIYWLLVLTCIPMNFWIKHLTRINLKSNQYCEVAEKSSSNQQVQNPSLNNHLYFDSQECWGFCLRFKLQLCGHS